MTTATSKHGAMPAQRPVPTTTYSQRVSARVRELRTERGWLVAELAERINRYLPEGESLATSTIHGWDNGNKKIDPDAYPAIAKAFGVKLPELLPAK